MNKFLFWAEKYLVKYFTLLLGLAIRYIEHTPRPKKPCIYVFWHRNIIPLLYLYRHKDIVIMISSSKDGELISGPAELFGYHPVRGSSTRQGVKAVREYLNLGKQYSLAITPDGPKGPREKLKKSILFLAFYTKLPIVHVAVDLDKEWVFRTWDLFRVPKPGCSVSVSYSEPIYIESKDDVVSRLDEVQLSMDRLTAFNRGKCYETKKSDRVQSAQ
jgi:lysophospholipid acyltransferase (LPLAT)-like uncharacterized protein